MAGDESRLAREFAELATVLHDQPALRATAEEVVAFAVDATSADHAGVSLYHAKQSDNTAATDPVVEQLDAMQTEVNEGPDLALSDEQPVILVVDTRHEDRWPTWAARAAEAGIGSVLAVRLSTPGKAVGALNLYARDGDAFDSDDHAVAGILARHAALALATALHEENLEIAVDARKRIGQAQGILMERFGLDQEQAFAVLRRYSQAHNIKLRAVAETLIETRQLPAGPEPDALPKGPTGP